jgi:hypothetical protein
MIKRPGTYAALAAVLGALMAGCGGSSSSSSAPTSSRTVTTGASSSAVVSRTSDGSSTPNGNVDESKQSASLASDPRIVNAISRCKSSIGAAPTLSSSAKSKLEGLCDQAAKGDLVSLRKASAQVCQDIVKESVPSSAQAQALAACPKP